MADFKLPKVAAAFPVFCQRIIPLTFDNSLSYLEFLGHVNVKLNEVICALNGQNLAFNDFVKLVDNCFESFKADIETRFTEYKEEVQQALDDLERAFDEDIAALQGEIDELSGEVNTLIKETGDLSVFPEKITTVDYTMEIESANCNIYFKNPDSDIWAVLNTNTTINDFLVGATAESVGDKNFLFLFCPPEGYPEDQFIFSAGAVVTATGATSEDSAAAIYSSETIPTEDFDTGLVLCANGVVTTSEQVDTVVITNSDEVQNYSCLYLSNSFVLGLLQPVLYSFSVSVSEIFGTLYSEKSGQNVFPRIKIDSTLKLDSNARVGVADSITEAITNLPSALAAKQDVIDSTNKLSADLVDDTATTNKFATAAELTQIETNRTDILSEQAKTSSMGTAGTNYIVVNNIRVYVSATAPTGTIPDGSVGVGW